MAKDVVGLLLGEVVSRVGLVRSGVSKVRTKRSGVLLSAHLACALLAHFASQART
jgi:hypothetical protein